MRTGRRTGVSVGLAGMLFLGIGQLFWLCLKLEILFAVYMAKGLWLAGRWLVTVAAPRIAAAWRSWRAGTLKADARHVLGWR